MNECLSPPPTLIISQVTDMNSVWSSFPRSFIPRMRSACPDITMATKPDGSRLLEGLVVRLSALNCPRICSLAHSVSSCINRSQFLITRLVWFQSAVVAYHLLSRIVTTIRQP